MSLGKLQQVKGTKDLLFDECRKFDYVCGIAQEIGERFGFQPVQTPIFEFQDIFCKTLGNSSDIIGKEMYSFVDRGGDRLTLRPEFTASMVRMFVCERLQPTVRLFTAGPVFRYERPQKCRQRQFHQINYEHFGAASAESDAEIISLAYAVIRELGIHDKVVLEINSLGSNANVSAYRKCLLDFLTKYEVGLSEDSKRRLHTNPLRILDSKDPRDISIINEAPTIEGFYDEDTGKYFDKVQNYLHDLGIPYLVNSKLVRGLDYYSSIVFEFKTSHLGSQDAVIAGGRYDNLVSLMGGEDVPAIGFAGGIERLMALTCYAKKPRFSVIILPICNEVLNTAMLLAHKIRQAGIKVFCEYTVVRLKVGLKRADKLQTDVALILGDEELNKEVVSCRDMGTGSQIEISFEVLTEHLKELEKLQQQTCSS